MYANTLPCARYGTLTATTRYFMNYLDRSNLTAAYVSGMRTDLKFQGKQFNIINTTFTVGYVMWVYPRFYSLRLNCTTYTC